MIDELKRKTMNTLIQYLAEHCILISRSTRDFLEDTITEALSLSYIQGRTDALLSVLSLLRKNELKKNGHSGGEVSP